MRYLLDTTVVSALRVRGREPQVQAWAAPIPVVDLFVTALTIAEIERGVVAKERADPAQGAILRQWLEEHVLPAFAGRVLPFDLAAARILATYPVTDQAPLDDALIAAIAQSTGMTIATRNTRHFEPLGVSIVNPWTHPESRHSRPAVTTPRTVPVSGGDIAPQVTRAAPAAEP